MPGDRRTTAHEGCPLFVVTLPKRPVGNRPSFSRNAALQGQALNVGIRQELTLNLRHRNVGNVPFPDAPGIRPKGGIVLR